MAQATETKGTTVTVTIDNVSSDKGSVMLGLYDEQTFMKTAPNKSASVPIKDGKAKATFENVEPGTYAVLCFHDENDNKKMDFEDNGMPAEGYGSSNNNNTYGPPVFADAKFEVKDQPIELAIKF